MFLKLDEKRKRSKGNSFSFTIKGKATDGSNVSKLQKNSLSRDGLTSSSCLLYFRMKHAWMRGWTFILNTHVTSKKCKKTRIHYCELRQNQCTNCTYILYIYSVLCWNIKINLAVKIHRAGSKNLYFKGENTVKNFQPICLCILSYPAIAYFKCTRTQAFKGIIPKRFSVKGLKKGFLMLIWRLSESLGARRYFC